MIHIWTKHMVDFRALARHHPAIRSYIRHRRWVDRAGVISYSPGIDSTAFSIDAFGFRRSQLAGTPYDLQAAFSGQPYGLVLGSSHVFGFGLASDGQTIPSQLADQTGVACLNLSFPEAQLQSLHAVALRICAQAPMAPQFIALLPGGSLTRYAYVRKCDPLFGVPDFRQSATDANLPGSPKEATAFASLLTYARFWIGQIADLAQTQGCPLLCYPEHTAFEKPLLSDAETSCGLTIPQSDPDRLRFETHRLRYSTYTSAILDAVPKTARVATVDPARLSFLDEFHYTADGAAQIATALANA